MIAFIGRFTSHLDFLQRVSVFCHALGHAVQCLQAHCVHSATLHAAEYQSVLRRVRTSMFVVFVVFIIIIIIIIIIITGFPALRENTGYSLNVLYCVQGNGGVNIAVLLLTLMKNHHPFMHSQRTARNWHTRDARCSCYLSQPNSSRVSMKMKHYTAASNGNDHNKLMIIRIRIQIVRMILRMK